MDVTEEQPGLEQAQSGHHGQPEGQDTGAKEQKGQGGRLSHNRRRTRNKAQPQKAKRSNERDGANNNKRRTRKQDREKTGTKNTKKWQLQDKKVEAKWECKKNEVEAKKPKDGEEEDKEKEVEKEWPDTEASHKQGSRRKFHKRGA